jgi:signal transduction histidine kinase
MFVWFGASILVAAFATGILAMIVHRPPAWVDEDRLSMFVGERFADTWERPERRALLAHTLSDEFNVDIVLKDARGGHVLSTGTCVHPSIRSPVRLDGVPVGEVLGCPRWRPGGITGRLAALAVFLGILWLASGLIARRIASPVRQVARVAKKLGDGDLSARVTLHKRANREAVVLGERFNEMASRIERQLADQRELLAVVSHELRTPLGHLRILAEMAEDAKDDDKRNKHLAEFHKELDEVDALVGELLASARLDFANLQRLDHDAADLLQEAFTRTGCDAPVEGEALTASADRTLLGRALANLVSNAEKHGGGVVLGKVYAEDDEVRLEVHDDGPGLSADALERAFEPFRRDGADDLSRPSLGLGLSLVRRIAEAHGGRAYLEARPGGGTIAGIALETT